MADEKNARTRPGRGTTEVERTGDVGYTVRRSFHAPAELVFEAWTDPALVKRWWAPASRGIAVLECDAEVREGGTYRYVLGRKDDRFVFTGTYREVTPPTRLVYTQRFEGADHGEALCTVTFLERGGVTEVVAHDLYPSKEVLDAVLKTGMEDGMRETYEQLDALLDERVAASGPERR